jgi:hypothetical protein
MRPSADSAHGKPKLSTKELMEVDSMDLDSDGMVSKDEFVKTQKKIFRRFDKNHDDMLDAAERAQMGKY